MNTVVRY